MSRSTLALLALLVAASSQGCAAGYDVPAERSDAAWARYRSDYERWRAERAAWEGRARPTRPRSDAWPRATDRCAPPPGASATSAELASAGLYVEDDWALPCPPPRHAGLELSWSASGSGAPCQPTSCEAVTSHRRRIVEYQPRPIIVCAPAPYDYPSTCATTSYPSTCTTTRVVTCFPSTPPVVYRTATVWRGSGGSSNGYHPTSVCRPAPVYVPAPCRPVTSGFSVGGGGIRVGFGAGFGRR